MVSFDLLNLKSMSVIYRYNSRCINLSYMTGISTCIVDLYPKNLNTRPFKIFFEKNPAFLMITPRNDSSTEYDKPNSDHTAK